MKICNLVTALLLAAPLITLAQSDGSVPQSGLPAPALAATPVICKLAGQFPNGVDQYGNALNCMTPAASQLQYVENDVTFSATPVFSATATVNYLLLTGSVTSSTLPAPTSGPAMTTIVLCQDTVGARTFKWPSNVRGGPTVSAAVSKCSAVTLVYVTALSSWVSTGPGVLGL